MENLIAQTSGLRSLLFQVAIDEWAGLIIFSVPRERATQYLFIFSVPGERYMMFIYLFSAKREGYMILIYFSVPGGGYIVLIFF